MGNGLVKRLRAKSIFKERDENINCQSLLQEMSNKISRGDSSNEPNVVCLDLWRTLSNIHGTYLGSLIQKHKCKFETGGINLAKMR